MGHTQPNIVSYSRVTFRHILKEGKISRPQGHSKVTASHGHNATGGGSQPSIVRTTVQCG
jgi:hypothetical protein